MCLEAVSVVGTLPIVANGHGEKVVLQVGMFDAWPASNEAAHLELIGRSDAFARKQQTGAITIDQEVDRVYVDTESECVIHDSKWQRRIHISKTGSHSTVVWNPWQEKAQAMGDMGESGHLGMLCVESANALENVVSIAPGQTHSMAVNYSVQKG